MNTNATRARRGARALGRVALAVGATAALCLVAVTDAAAHLSAPPGATTSTTDAGAVEGPESQGSQAFRLTNLTGYRLQLVHVQGDQKFDERPGLYSYLTPGAQQTWKIEHLLFRNQSNTALYDLYDLRGRVVDRLEVTMVVAGNLEGTTMASAKVSHQSLRFVFGSGSRDIQLKEPTGGTRVIDGDQAQDQASALNVLCASRVSNVDCSFRVTGSKPEEVTKEEALTPQYANRMSEPFIKELTTTKTQSVTESVEVTAAARAHVYGLVEASISGTYGRSWTKSLTYTEKEIVTVKPGTKVWQTGDFPMLRYTGDFTVRIDDTTWVLRGVSFEAPDPNPAPGRAFTMTWHQAALTDGDRGLQTIQSAPSRIELP